MHRQYLLLMTSVQVSPIIWVLLLADRQTDMMKLVGAFRTIPKGNYSSFTSVLLHNTQDLLRYEYERVVTKTVILLETTS